ncbi:LPXTG cell wall anchor domain-containing protein [Streptococcus suis]
MTGLLLIFVEYYSRVERAHTLPNTGSEDNIVLMGIGFVLAGLGLAGARRRRHG